MVAADDDRGLDLAVAYELVEEQARLVPLAVAEPADARGQPLEVDELARRVEPPVQVLVVGEELLERRVGDGDVLGVTGQGDPAKGAEALAEERPDVGRDEAGELEGPRVARVPGLVADAVAVVEDLGALVLELDHRLDLRGHRLAGLLREALRIGLGLALPLVERDLRGQVAQRVVRARLVRDDVDLDLAGAVTAQDLGEDLGGIADETDGQGAALPLRLHDLGEGDLEIGLDLVEVALRLAPAQP